MENIVKEIWDEVKMKGNIVQGIYAIEKVSRFRSLSTIQQ